METKTCNTCGIEKSVLEFNLHHAKISTASKYRGQCKLCQAKSRNREKENLRGAEYRKIHAEEIRQKKKEYLSNPDNIEKNRAYAKKYYYQFPQRQRDRLFKKYGITANQYDEMLLQQNGGCAICGVAKNGRKQNFVIDHDHKTGRVRSLLCTQCNAGLGNYKDSPSLLRKAADYLDSFTNQYP